LKALLKFSRVCCAFSLFGPRLQNAPQRQGFEARRVAVGAIINIFKIHR
jgi:hypothetical protein